MTFENLTEATDRCRELSDRKEDEEEREAEKEIEYIQVVSRAKAAVEDLRNSSRPATPAAPSQPQAVRLEHLVLPVFNGDITQFPQFWSVFCSRVHEDTSLSAVDKFSYLLSKLSGSAYQCVKCLNVTPEGYQEARKLLLQRYGKTIPLVNDHIRRIIDIPCSEAMDAGSLRKLADALQINVRSLSTLGVDIQSNAQILGPILLGKLPVSLRIKWQESLLAKGKADSTIESPRYEPMQINDFLEFVTINAEHREMGQQAKISTKDSFIPKSKFKSGTAATLNMRGRSSACTFCGDSGHVVRLCPKLLDVDPKVRHDMVKSRGLCFNCLSNSHGISKCNSKFSCKHCKGRHHTILCQKSSKLGVDGLEFKDKSNSFSANNSVSVCVARVSDPLLVGPSSSRKVRILLDGCSNHSYVSSDVANALKLPSVGSTHMKVHVFNKGTVTKQMDVCNIKIFSLVGTESISLQAYKSDVCEPLSSPAIPVHKIPHLQGLEFSDTYGSSEPKQVDVLIGFDHMYDVLTGSFLRGPRGTPVALESRFGWLLHGPYGWRNLTGFGSADQAHCFFTLRTEVEPSFSEFVDRLCDGDLKNTEPEPSWSTPVLKDGRFSVSLPWKLETRPDSNLKKVIPYQVGVYKNLKGASAAEYWEYFSEYQSLGIIEPCSDEIVDKCWYLPHHGIRQKGKLRVVFDGSYGKPSINQLLQTGPNNASLHDIVPPLCSWRT